MLRGQDLQGSVSDISFRQCIQSMDEHGEEFQQQTEGRWPGRVLRTAPIIFLRSFMLSGPSWFMMPGIISVTSAHDHSKHRPQGTRHNHIRCMVVCNYVCKARANYGGSAAMPLLRCDGRGDGKDMDAAHSLSGLAR